MLLEKAIPLCNRLVFLFKIGIKEINMLPLVNNMSFVYNGKFLTHQHAYTPTENDDATKFFNISFYGNEKTCNHLRRTFAQMITNK